MNSPSISVIMAAYNAEDYILESIYSILKQTFMDFEFIIVDDGSQDLTLKIIEGVEDIRIKIIKNESNLGLAASLNKALRLSKGKYVARMDADDISNPDRLAKQFYVLENNLEFDVCVTPYQIFGSECSTVGEGNKTDAEIKAELIWGTPTTHGTMLIRSQKIRRHNLYYDETFGVGQDWKFWYDVKDYIRIYHLNEILYYYRRGTHNVTVQHKEKAKERTLRMHRILLAEFGVSFSEEDLLMHQFINGQFSLQPTAAAINQAKRWYKVVLKHNNLSAKYDLLAFEENMAKKWERLFFLIVPYGLKCIGAYIISSGIGWSQFLYCLKFYFNKALSAKS